MTVNKLKLYLDTSVISYLDQKDAPEKTAETRLFWEKLKAGKFDVVISDTVIREIGNCGERKKQTLTDFLNEISYSVVPVDKDVTRIADWFVKLNILKEKSFDDCRHLAAAIVSRCDAIVSWNFKHIVNHKTFTGVKAVTALEGYKDLLIYPPSFFTGGDDDTL
jgi:predicted nucleic acid-binding protein